MQCLDIKGGDEDYTAQSTLLSVMKTSECIIMFIPCLRAEGKYSCELCGNDQYLRLVCSKFNS